MLDHRCQLLPHVRLRSATEKPRHRVPRRLGESLTNPFASSHVPLPDLLSHLLISSFVHRVQRSSPSLPTLTVNLRRPIPPLSLSTRLRPPHHHLPRATFYPMRVSSSLFYRQNHLTIRRAHPPPLSVARSLVLSFGCRARVTGFASSSPRCTPLRTLRHCRYHR